MMNNSPLPATARADAAILERRDSAAADPRDPRRLGRRRAANGSARLARRARARGPVRRRRDRADVQGTDRVSYLRTRLAVRSRRNPRRPRAADAPLVDGPRGALAPLPTKPAQRTGRRPDLADRDPADPRLHRRNELIPSFAAPENRVLATLVGSDAGQAFLDGAWGWYGLLLAMFLFNTVLGEELLFRGYLLPRMNGAFGRGDWVVNGFLFTVYHLHVPWVMPATLVESFLLAYPTKRYRSAWIGIAVHSAQSVFFAIALLLIVL